MTTREPGARLVLTHGGVRSPRSTAFFASSPAATITSGFEVFVQLVIAAITTEPFESSYESPLEATATGAEVAPASISSAMVARAEDCASLSEMRSCGRFGPARLGSMVPRSSSSTSLYSGSGVSSVRKSCCSRQYASTSAICSSERPVKRM